MNFMAFVLIITTTIVVASLITNMIRGIMIFLSISSLAFYLFVATPAQKTSMDAFANTMVSTNGGNIIDVAKNYINENLKSIGVTDLLDTMKSLKETTSQSN